jgi:hypothetical protein
MNVKAFLTTFMLLFSFLSIGQGAAPEDSTVLDNDEAGGRGRLMVDESVEDPSGIQTTMEKISEKFPEVNKAYEACNSDPKPNTEATVEDCMWKEIGADVQRKVTEYLDDEKEARKDNPSLITGAQRNYRTTKDKTTRQLESYLKERLKNILFDEDKEGANVLSDHSQYYKIYKSQLGQNIIRVTSDLCMYASDVKNSDGHYIGTIHYGEDMHKNRNLKNLSVADTDTNTPITHNIFQACIKNIPNECKAGKKEACLVLKYMEEAKRGIQDASDLHDELNSTEKSSSLLSGSTKENTDKKEIAKATLLASGEIDKAKLAEIAKEEELELDTCAQDTNPNLSADCQLYLTNKDDQESIEVEFMIRQKAIEEKIKTELDKVTGDQTKQEEVIRSILTDEGMSEEQVTKYLEKYTTNPDDAVSDIKARYEQKRIALIKDLTARDFDNRDATSTTGKSENQESFEKLRDVAKDTTNNFKESIHFANIVGSFITISDGSGTEGLRNTNALATELADSGFSDTSASSHFNADHNRDLTEILNNTKNRGSDDELAELEAETVESLIYDLDTK